VEAAATPAAVEHKCQLEKGKKFLARCGFIRRHGHCTRKENSFWRFERSQHCCIQLELQQARSSCIQVQSVSSSYSSRLPLQMCCVQYIGAVWCGFLLLLDERLHKHVG
jgi:hypothetical protein